MRYIWVYFWNAEMDIFGCIILYFVCFSSVPFPKDIKHFKREREQVIKRAMKVGEILEKILQFVVRPSIDRMEHGTSNFELLQKYS